MKLTLLIDNHTYINQYYLGEPAFSCWIEEEGKHFLLDTGYSNAFLHNAEKMGLPIRELDTVILSHGHDDHTGGLRYLCGILGDRRPQLVAHPDVFQQKYADGLAMGCPIQPEELEKHLELRLTREPLWLTERLVFLGEIPTQEPRATVGVLEDGSPDACLDDSALAYAGREGVYIITGCSHSGICSITEYAKQVTGHQKILGILGGFHLFQNDARAQRTIQYLAEQQIPELWPCHCTSFAVRAAMSRQMEVREAGVNLTLEWE